MEEKLALCLKRIEILEKKVEMYYRLLMIQNEVEFVLNGTYVTQEDMETIMSGEY